jgi:alanine dehydrogenase
MQIGVPKEIKDQEYRVGLTPDSVKELVSQGQEVFIQQGAGEGIDFTDDQYRAVGAVGAVVLATWPLLRP